MRTLLCFGDSNTWGYNPESAPSTERYPRDVRWPGRLARALGDEWEVIAEGVNGRTAARDDPIWEGRNGAAYLLPCLRSHAPLDLVVIYLGTNDVADRYSLPAEDVAYCVGRLVRIARTSETGPVDSAPEVLVVCPPPFGRLEPLYEGGREVAGPRALVRRGVRGARLRAARPRRDRLLQRPGRDPPRRGRPRRRRGRGRTARARALPVERAAILTSCARTPSVPG